MASEYFRGEKNIVLMLFYGFGISSLVAPVWIANKIFFGILLMILLFRLIIKGKLLVPTITPLIFVCIYIYGFVNSFRVYADIQLAVQFLNFSCVLLLICLIYTNNIDMDKFIKFCGIVMLVTTYIFYMLVYGQVSFFGSDKILDFFTKYSYVAVGERSFTDNSMTMLHLGTVPFIFLPACLFFKDYLDNRKLPQLLVAVLMFVVMILSTSRGLIAAFCLGVAMLIYLKKKGMGRFFVTILLFFCFVNAIIFFNEKSMVFSPYEVSNSIKIGHAISFVKNLSIFNAVFGTGLASYYYSEGLGRYVAHTEITLLDTIRYFGFILTTFLYLAMIFPVKKMKGYTGKGRNALILFLIYVGLSMTNPVLFNSFGALVILWYWSVVIKNKGGEVNSNESVCHSCCI